MAVALSLLIILPALAENTNGEVTQGRGTVNELIVGVYDPVAVGARAGRDIPGTPGGGTDGTDPPTEVVAAAFSETLRPEDTFANGKLYVSNRHDPFENGSSVEGGYNTVLVTQLRTQGTEVNATLPDCVTVKVKNTRSGGATITLTLVPSDQGRNADGTLASGRSETSENRYYQNYFRVAGR